LAAWRWRRAVEAELRGLGLTFTPWLVLAATDALIRESKDAVNQNAVAARTELDRTTVSQVMVALERLGHVDRGPDFIGPGYRIWITSSGRKALTLAKAGVVAAADAWASDEQSPTRTRPGQRRNSLPAERARRD
jgi:DNA-binding MarR family transcriptional regulator